MRMTKTERGFRITKFKDKYGGVCSIQESSLATDACIWFGVSDPEVKVLIPGTGWTNVPLPEGTSIHSRMHLDRKMVKNLLPLLRYFVRTGYLPKRASVKKGVRK